MLKRFLIFLLKKFSVFSLKLKSIYLISLIKELNQKILFLFFHKIFTICIIVTLNTDHSIRFCFNNIFSIDDGRLNR